MDCWVKGEIDLALGRAHEALGKFAGDPADSAQLKFARTHLHQAHGALSIDGLDGVTQVSEAIELLLARIEHPEAPVSHKCLGNELVIRGSTGRQSSPAAAARKKSRP